MRNYICKKNNPFIIPHNVYMQMLYLLRDYESGKTQPQNHVSAGRKAQWIAVEKSLERISQQYEGSAFRGHDALRAFFDYPYYSCSFVSKRKDEGASKRSWSLYRSRLAHDVAKELGLCDRVKQEARKSSIR